MHKHNAAHFYIITEQTINIRLSENASLNNRLNDVLYSQNQFDGVLECALFNIVPLQIIAEYHRKLPFINREARATCRIQLMVEILQPCVPRRFLWPQMLYLIRITTIGQFHRGVCGNE
jgi:hypothetical protein